ncbi:50S ribosomal protein L4 [Candidatus Gracilibacteria bacterium]|nr:50S ribosomal protein L4 [Candidatus Gracilibacteria bacterium]
MKAPLYSQDGKKTGEIELPAHLFASKVNEFLVHSALVRQHANARQPSAHTLRRGEVKRSTAKIMRQKGSGKARKGDRGSPILRGGGIAWGPRNTKNYTKAMPKKQRRLALASMLTVKAKDLKILALESFTLENPKTKAFEKLRNSLPKSRSLLVVHSRNDILAKSSRNLEFVKPLLVNLLNPHDLTKFDQILFEKSALEEAGKIFKIEKKVVKVDKVEKVNKVEKKEPAKKIVSKKETAGVV